MSVSRGLADIRALLRRIRGRWGASSASTQPREHPLPAGDKATASITIAPAPFDLEQEIRFVLNELINAGRQPRLEIAVQPDLTLRAEREEFRQVLAKLVRQACSQPIVGRVLVTASQHGEWVQLGVSDDAIGTDSTAWEEALQPIERTIAGQGGTLDVTSWSDQGSSVVTRWPVAGPPAREPGQPSRLARERTAAI
jgi:signal transduction histidine kinase